LAGGLAFLSFAGIAYLAYLSRDSTVLVLAAGFLRRITGILALQHLSGRIFMGDAGSQLLGFSMGVLVLLIERPWACSLSRFRRFARTRVAVPRYDRGHGATACEGPLTLHRRPQPCAPQASGARTVALRSRHRDLCDPGGDGRSGVSPALAIRCTDSYHVRRICLAMFTLFVATERRQVPSYHFIERPGALRHQTRPGRIVAQRYGPPGFWPSSFRSFLIANVFLPGHVPMDVGYAAISLCCVVLAGMWFMPQYRSHFVRGGLYVGSAFLMYMGEQSGIPDIWPIYVTQNTLLALIALLVLLSMRFSRGNRFQTTPAGLPDGFFRLDRPLAAGNAGGYADPEHPCGQVDRVVLFI
jgi:UDP-GlcNAc:undecaprenyl-phosphate GlcNAc-1-phosphate transferase